MGEKSDRAEESPDRAPESAPPLPMGPRDGAAEPRGRRRVTRTLSEPRAIGIEVLRTAFLIACILLDGVFVPSAVWAGPAAARIPTVAALEGLALGAELLLYRRWFRRRPAPERG